MYKNSFPEQFIIIITPRSYRLSDSEAYQRLAFLRKNEL